MNEKKVKRLPIPLENYDSLIFIGRSVTGTLNTDAALAGIHLALEHYTKTSTINLDQYQALSRFDGIDESIMNNIEALHSLAKNAGLNKDEVEARINSALKAIITSIIATQ